MFSKWVFHQTGCVEICLQEQNLKAALMGVYVVVRQTKWLLNERQTILKTCNVTYYWWQKTNHIYHFLYHLSSVFICWCVPQSLFYFSLSFSFTSSLHISTVFFPNIKILISFNQCLRLCWFFLRWQQQSVEVCICELKFPHRTVKRERQFAVSWSKHLSFPSRFLHFIRWPPAANCPLFPPPGNTQTQTHNIRQHTNNLAESPSHIGKYFWTQTKTKTS